MSVIDTIWHRWLRRPYVLSSVETGQGQTVLLLHGVGADGGVWQPLVLRLDPERYRVIVPDLLGFGASPKPQWNQYAVQDHARQVVAMLRRRGVRNKVTIVGHSMGCLIATHIAATNPGLVKHLVLYEPPLYADDPDFSSHQKRREYYFALYEFIAKHRELAFTQARFMWRMARRLIGFSLSEEMWVPFQRSLRNTIMQQTAYEQLHSIHIPTDIVHGRFDIVVARTELRRMYKQNKHITWHTVSDVHGVSPRSARYLAELVIQPGKRRQRRRIRRQIKPVV